MMPRTADRLVIFDYSGTLSLEAPRFGRTENLRRALAESGLADLGVSTPEFFWEEIVFPTWVTGSTTDIGYKRLMAQCIMDLGMGRGRSGTEIAAAASCFVDDYLGHSRVDPGWRPILAELYSDPAAAVVIATDHYAEATEAIVRHFGRWGIRARRAGAPAADDGRSFLIANSADMGYWKADRRFWMTLRRNALPGEIRSLMIVDDFGFNEEQGDRYGEREKVEARKEATGDVLQEVFEKSPTVIPFFLEGPERDPEQNGCRRIAEVAGRIRSFQIGG